MNRKNFHLLVFVLFLLVACRPLAGCGGVAPNMQGRPPLPVSASSDEHRPNYLGDLKGAYFWAKPVITYRIVTENATDLRLDANNRVVPISFVVPTPDQANAIRKGVIAWAEPLKGLRVIEERPGSDTTANVDIVLRDSDNMPDANSEDDQDDKALGHTDPWWNQGRDKPTMGRAVIHLRSDLNNRDLEETARHESGHGIIGFWGHSRHVGDVMYPRKLWFTRVKKLTEYDVNSAKANYKR